MLEQQPITEHIRTQQCLEPTNDITLRKRAVWFLCHNVHWPKSSPVCRIHFACSVSILSPNGRTTDKNLLVATNTLLYVKFLIIDKNNVRYGVLVVKSAALYILPFFSYVLSVEQFCVENGGIIFVRSLKIHGVTSVTFSTSSFATLRDETGHVPASSLPFYTS